MADLDRGQLYLAEGRKGESLDGFWEGLGPAGRRGREAIAMDMWEPYIQSTCRHVPGAEVKIVFDKFHVVKHLHEAVDRVRRVEQRARFRALWVSDLRVARAWALKERFRQLGEYRDVGAAQRFFQRWFWRATHSRLGPMARVVRLIRRHLPNVLTYLRHRIANAGLEAVNATIPWVKKTSRGFRNVEHFTTAIYFHCGGLDLYPHQSR